MWVRCGSPTTALRKGVEVALGGVEYWAPRRPTAAVRHDPSLHAPLGADLLALLPRAPRTDIGLQAAPA